MATLFISAKWYAKDKITGESIGKPEEKRSWETYFKKTPHIGFGYILTQDEVDKLRESPSKVVLIRNDKLPRKAEASFIDAKPTKKAENGGQRYDVYFRDPKEVTHVYEKLNRRGISFYKD